MPSSVLQIAGKPATAVQKKCSAPGRCSANPNNPALPARQSAGVLQQIEESNDSRNTAIVEAHANGAYSYQQIAEHFGIHSTSVGRVVRNGS